MAQHKLASRLRSYRKQSGLSQQELAELIGYASEDPVARHELATSIPPFLVALAYQAIFRVSVSELFPGIYETVVHGVEERLVALESKLQGKSAQDRDANATARTLEWTSTRRNGTQT